MMAVTKTRGHEGSLARPASSLVALIVCRLTDVSGNAIAAVLIDAVCTP